MMSSSLVDVVRLASKSARLTYSGSVMGGFCQPSGEDRIAGSLFDIGTAQSNCALHSYAARIARSIFDISRAPSYCAFHSYAARIARPIFDFSSGHSHCESHTKASRIPLTASGNGAGSQQSVPSNHHLYKEASTNPLPSGYGFNAAPPIAKSQHGHVTPPLKEKLHHG